MGKNELRFRREKMALEEMETARNGAKQMRQKALGFFFLPNTVLNAAEY